MTDQPPGYRYYSKNLDLTAAEVMGEHFRPVILFGGTYSDGRILAEISFEMNLDVESFEQGVAWIAYGVGQGGLRDPHVDWLEKGYEWADTLPWVRDRKEYEARPNCSVEREWFRVPVKKLRELADKASEQDLASFSFDGEVLKVRSKGTTIAAPASGLAWDRSYSVKTRKLEFLPKRLMSHLIDVSVWRGRLYIGNTLFELAESGGKDTKE